MNAREQLAEAALAVRDAALEAAYPTRCVGCEEPGTLLCDDCRAALPWINQALACPTCGTPFGGLTCTQCGHDWPVRATVCALSSARTPTRLASVYKDGHELRLAPVIAAALATALDEAAGVPALDGSPRYDAAGLDALAFVPATREAYLRRGFDHMQLVATALARELDLPLADVLARRPSADQRGLGRQGRLANLAGTVEVVRDVAGMDLLLADDVITTGASVRACAEALLARGAHSVTACALVRVW